MNNEAEWMALMHGLELLDAIANFRLLVFRYSHHVILKMITGYSSGSISCIRIYDIVTLLVPGIIELFHILRENNAQVDALANLGASLP